MAAPNTRVPCGTPPAWAPSAGDTRPAGDAAVWGTAVWDTAVCAATAGSGAICRGPGVGRAAVGCDGSDAVGDAGFRADQRQRGERAGQRRRSGRQLAADSLERPGPAIGRRDNRVRQQHDRGGAAVGRAPQRHGDLMLGREPRHDEQAQLVAVGQVELRRAGQVLVVRRDVLGADADAAVLDFRREAVRDALGPDRDLGVGRRVGRRVLDQLGHQVDYVRDGGPDHRLR